VVNYSTGLEGTLQEEVKEKLKTPPWDEAIIVQELDYVPTKLGISANELQGFFDARLTEIKNPRNMSMR
jgi:hypothetical protein